MWDAWKMKIRCFHNCGKRKRKYERSIEENIEKCECFRADEQIKRNSETESVWYELKQLFAHFSLYSHETIDVNW